MKLIVLNHTTGLTEKETKILENEKNAIEECIMSSGEPESLKYRNESLIFNSFVVDENVFLTVSNA